MLGDTPWGAGIIPFGYLTGRQGRERRHGRVGISDVGNAGHDTGARLVRIADPVPDKPVAVAVMDHDPGRLTPVQHRTLDDSSEIGREHAVREGLQPVTENLMRHPPSIPADTTRRLPEPAARAGPGCDR